MFDEMQEDIDGLALHPADMNHIPSTPSRTVWVDVPTPLVPRQRGRCEFTSSGESSPTAAVGSAEESISRNENDPVLGRYWRMARMGVTVGSVLAKMRMDHRTEEEQNRVMAVLDPSTLHVPMKSRENRENTAWEEEGEGEGEGEGKGESEEKQHVHGVSSDSKAHAVFRPVHWEVSEGHTWCYYLL